MNCSTTSTKRKASGRSSTRRPCRSGRDQHIPELPVVSPPSFKMAASISTALKSGSHATAANTVRTRSAACSRRRRCGKNDCALECAIFRSTRTMPAVAVAVAVTRLTYSCRHRSSAMFSGPSRCGQRRLTAPLAAPPDFPTGRRRATLTRALSNWPSKCGRSGRRSHPAPTIPPPGGCRSGTSRRTTATTRLRPNVQSRERF